MSQAQFTVPLITVIPGQLITAALWNNEWTNIQTNLNPSGVGGYSDTDTQMQIQTAPYPGSITSHASSLAGELERIRYQISQILGATTPAFWYAAPPTNLTSLASATLPLGGIFDYHSATPPSANFLLANGQAIGRSAFPALNTLYSAASYPFGNGDGATTFNLPNYTDRVPIAAGNLYAIAAIGGAVSNIPTISITDPGHNHTQNAHTHTMGNHTHSTPNHQHQLDSTVITGGSPSGNVFSANSNGADLNTANGGVTVSGSRRTKNQTDNSGAGTSGAPSNNTDDPTTATNNSNTTGITAGSSSVPTLPPYIGMYKMIRVL